MSWTAQFRPGDVSYVELGYIGMLKAHDLQEALAAGIKLGREHDTWLVLADCSRLDGGHTIVDLFGLAAALAELGAAQRFREALIAPVNPDVAETVKFWETTSLNRGLQVRMFPERDAAVEWLIASH